MIRPRLAPSAAYRQRQELRRRAHLAGWYHAWCIEADMRRRWPSLGVMRGLIIVDDTASELRAPLPAASLDDEYNRAIQALQSLRYRPRGGLAGGAVTPPPPAPALSGSAAAAPADADQQAPRLPPAENRERYVIEFSAFPESAPMVAAHPGTAPS